VADGINLRLRRRDMNVFRTIDEDGRRPVVHVAGRHPVALCPSCSRPSVTTNGTGWRDVIDVVRTVVVTLSICVRRFVCEFEDCDQRSFDERFEGIGRGGASDRALAFFADLQRGRSTRRVAIDLGVPHHCLRLAVGKRHRAPTRCQQQPKALPNQPAQVGSLTSDEMDQLARRFSTGLPGWQLNPRA
jgi:transposase